MRQRFVDRKFRKAALETIDQANDIIDEFQGAGITLTLRQLYYQFVGQALIPNTERSYKRLGDVISNARLAGLMDWDAIEDRMRQPVVWAEHDSIKDMLEDELRSFRLRRLDGQHNYVELWVEKDALASVLQPIAADYHVTLMVNRGYSSSSAKRSADRIRYKMQKYDSAVAFVLYLGDLDPSGEDMVRDIDDRLDLFTRGLGRRGLLTVEKLALTIDQVNQYQPPPNPTKLTDSRAAGFIAEYGYESWEVDALPPKVLRQLIEDRLGELLDMDLQQEVVDEEDRQREHVEQALELL